MSTANGSPSTEEKDRLAFSESDIDSASDSESESQSDSEDEHIPTKGSYDLPEAVDQPASSPFKRFALILITIVLLWVALSTGKSLWGGKKASKVIYASRYSKEHKFRPAASPIITETLKDGRIRIRGAGPTATPTPTSVAKKTKKTKTRRRGKKTVKRGVKKSPNRK